MHQTLPGRVNIKRPFNGQEVFPDNWNGLDRLDINRLRAALDTIVAMTISTLHILAEATKDQCAFSEIRESCFKQQGHELQNMCIKHKKGSSFVYKELVAAKAKKKKFEQSPAYTTSKHDQGHTMTKGQWMMAMRKLSKIHCSPKARWQSFQIFYRTLWTPQKLYFSTDILDHALCPGCNDHWPANTAHLMYECPRLARNVWNCVQSIMTEVKGHKFKVSKFAALYYHRVEVYADITVITAAKRAILRVIYDVAAGTRIHPKVAMACLRKELITTARTNIKKEKDTLTWMDIERVTLWKWKEMSDNRLYIIPDPDEDEDTLTTRALRADQSNTITQEPDILGSDSEEDEEQFF